MGVFKGSLAALIFTGAAAVTAGSAFAADILPPPPPIAPPMAVAAEFSGWYIRGDVGIGQNTKEEFRSTFAPGFVVPGLRPAGGAMGDQKRAVTPREARDNGASVLVIGRPISRAEDPVAAARAIEATL